MGGGEENEEERESTDRFSYVQHWRALLRLSINLLGVFGREQSNGYIKKNKKMGEMIIINPVKAKVVEK